MPVYDAVELEVLATYERYVETRATIIAGDEKWSKLAEFFTEDAVFIDPAWGRVEGREAIAVFMDESMEGLDWDFPEIWTMVSGTRLVTMFQNRLPQRRSDGGHFECPGISVLEYAGDSQFNAETDIINMAHMMEVIGESGWTPAGPMNMPPANPVRG